MPSAKYCCAGSLLRLANGRTTIDSRGAERPSDIAPAAGAFDAEDAGANFFAGHTHHAVPAMTNATKATAVTTAVTVRRRRGVRDRHRSDTDRLATASGRNA